MTRSIEKGGAHLHSTRNRRFVFTGGPGAGKTTLLDALGVRGYRCVPETARAIIKARIEAGLSPRPQPKEFATMIFEADVRNYRGASSRKTTFFDRSVIDALGMMKESAAMSSADIEENLRRYVYNKTVFLLPPWEAIYHVDEERDQSFADAVRVFGSLRAWYASCGYDLLEVPVGPVDMRVEFVTSQVAGAG